MNDATLEDLSQLLKDTAAEIRSLKEDPPRKRSLAERWVIWLTCLILSGSGLGGAAMINQIRSSMEWVQYASTRPILTAEHIDLANYRMAKKSEAVDWSDYTKAEAVVSDIVREYDIRNLYDARRLDNLIAGVSR